jgi:hypothetical protein
MGKKKSHEYWVKEKALKKQKQTLEDQMDIVGPQSDLLELEEALKDSDDDVMPMDVDRRDRKALGLNVKKKIEKAKVAKRKVKKSNKAVQYMER